MLMVLRISDCPGEISRCDAPWLGLATWGAATRHLNARDGFIGSSEDQRRRRLALVVNNNRPCVLPVGHYPNLISRSLSLDSAIEVQPEAG
jgi:hypothetical protein